MAFNTEQESYLALRNIVAERTRPLLAFVGSGVSAQAGLPTWASLRATLIDGLTNKAEDFPSSDRKRLLAAAESARTEPNSWVAFEMLFKSLGKTTFRDLIRAQFEDAYRIAPPAIYAELWGLGIKGMLTLNIDRLASRSLLDVHQAGAHIELNGQAVDRLTSHLSGPRPFIGNLHGIVEDTDTWVLTHSQLTRLSERAAYRTLFATCLSMFTIVFVGLSVDDVAVGGHLQRLTDRHVEFPTHFWITPRRDLAVDRWAESVGVRIVRYDATGGNHDELAELFKDLRSFVPVESTDLPPVRLEATAEGDMEVEATDALTVGDVLPPQDEMMRLTAEEIRQVLNAHASVLLATESEESYEAYEAFSRGYDQAIYRAWYTTAEPTDNMLLGYELKERVARGAFGLVYRAYAPGGAPVAVKVLLDEIRQDPEALRSFRRGVRSMKILQERGVAGMAAYMQASEIPAFVVMEWIEGPTLAEAKKAHVIDDWASIIEIARRLTATIRSAHLLPERVLHRDIRPSNVMLREYWTAQGDCDVVVLDFDLSWHRGAAEKSVLHTSSAGYLAPEQLQPMAGASTRSAFVDSFGIGMTLFYLCGGVEPYAGQHRRDSWADDVNDACRTLPRPSWISLPARVARLILAATRHVQSARWDMAEIQRELDLLSAAITPWEDVKAPELIVEEVAARCGAMQDYVWDEDDVQAVRDLGTGLRLGLGADLTNDEVEMRIDYLSTGVEERTGLGRYIVDRARTIAEQFKAVGWKVASESLGQGAVSIRATVPVDALAADVGAAAETLDGILARLTFDRAHA
jgi:hypothetical protein